MTDIRMPRLSDTMEEGVIAGWLKKPGDPVAEGEVLVEIETDKAVMEYEAYETGTLTEILVPEGGSAPIGAVIARLDDGTKDPADTGPAADTTADTGGEAAGGRDREPGPGRAGTGTPTPAATPATATPTATPTVPSAAGTREQPGTERPVATPLVRRLARERGVDLAALTGSGPGGRIIRADLDTATPTPAPATAGTTTAQPAPTPSPSDEREPVAVPFDATRRTLARRLAESSAATPQFTVTTAADVDALLTLREHLNTSLATTGTPTVTVNDLVVRACALALRAHPEINASYSPDGQGRTLIHGRVHIGIAVASPNGLVVPVIRDADRAPVSRIAAETRRLAALARDRGLTPADFAAGTFTVSNLGMYGVEQFTALINPPQGAILAVGAAAPEPAVVDGNLTVRRRVRCTLSADHRIIDGAQAARFLATLTALLEDPLRILA